MIECRVVDPNNGDDSSPTGIFLHFHGGGLSVGRHDMSVQHFVPFSISNGSISDFRPGAGMMLYFSDTQNHLGAE
jgi:hypothetical protein